MLPAELLRLRLRNQSLSFPAAGAPAALLAHLGAAQAQDYSHGLWAVGVRRPGLSATAVEQELTAGRLVRTWLLRGTLHLPRRPTCAGCST